jgi:hypothetical protein
MSPTRPCAIYATATPCGGGLYCSHHVSWAATPVQLNIPARHLLPGKGAGASAHTYAPALHTDTAAAKALLRRPNRTSQRPPLAALATSAAPETPVAVVINAVIMAGQTAHQLMLLLGQQLATQRSLLGAEVNIRCILHVYMHTGRRPIAAAGVRAGRPPGASWPALDGMPHRCACTRATSTLLRWARARGGSDPAA